MVNFLFYISLLLLLIISAIISNECFDYDTFFEMMSKERHKMNSLGRLIWRLPLVRAKLFAIVLLISLIILPKCITGTLIHIISKSIILFIWVYQVFLSFVKSLKYSLIDLKNIYFKKIAFLFCFLIGVLFSFWFLLLLLTNLWKNSAQVTAIFIYLDVFLIAIFMVWYKLVLKDKTHLSVLCVVSAVILILFSFVVGCTMEETENTEFYQTYIYNKKQEHTTKTSSAISNNEMLNISLQMTLKGAQELTTWSFEDSNVKKGDASKYLKPNTMKILMISCVEYWIFDVLVLSVLVSRLDINRKGEGQSFSHSKRKRLQRSRKKSSW
ncbi:hypothetical protein LP41P_01705 [Lactiplantibacillus plantarum]|uniref:hypothetical protein n=1 Tax=Lactiplantibacillus plantarum TaxID=1590 RepID=UPI00117B46F0|nr:hypothetical protein [Lactiplantibacillus plantarum]MBW4798516.1 hypothetical protein [Lactiplantibacillus plantarum]MBW4809367.1 hypothetical protein [Lactiplantibacillus plantarum]MBW4812306.1 hypothetical protein [Lactiplantibacillus plantarum]MCT3260154.1 hypothetical protein [Lactiplantibacillus plantarum]MCW6120200.1 hypothetical protein [Lactiplantibacillus plantarum]